jgi:hypothetical protein
MVLFVVVLELLLAVVFLFVVALAAVGCDAVVTLFVVVAVVTVSRVPEKARFCAPIMVAMVAPVASPIRTMFF